MKIKETANYLGKPLALLYRDSDNFDELPKEKCRQVYGVCFYNGLVVLGFSRRMQKWSLIGGTVEPNETIEEALIREIKEESNMKVLKYWPIGYQEVVDEGVYQLRYACIVEPYGPFKKDPDAGEGYGVDKICTVDPQEFTKYVQWGKIGKRLIERAQEIVAKNR